MEDEYKRLTDAIISRARALPKGRLLVAIAGAPGSGKTTIAKEVLRRVNHLLEPATEAALVPMDGFHLPRVALDALPNREEAYTRRGAPWTFDVHGFLRFMRQLREWANTDPESDTAYTSAKQNALYAPSFDHKTKDPVENSIAISNRASIVLLEGNYLLFDEPHWQEIAAMADMRVFVETDLIAARDRLAKRHVQAGIEKTLEDGYKRVDSNDYLNGVDICDKLIAPDVVVRSVPDEKLL